MHPEQRPSRDRSSEALEARLRALPVPAVPDGLQARLLATIPTEIPLRKRRWPVWGGAASALAAACLLAVILWQGRIGNNSRSKGSRSDEATERIAVPKHEKIRPPGNAAASAALPLPRVLDAPEIPTFTWPIEEPARITVLTAIPPELFD